MTTSVALPRIKSTTAPARIARAASRNRLINMLPRADRERFLSACETVDLKLGKVLYEPGQRLRHAWFPLDGCVSVSNPATLPAQKEVELIGSEGMLAGTLALDIGESYQRALVMDAGTALQIGVVALRRELLRGRALRRVLNRYVYVLMMKLAQNAACVASHRIEQRLARLLLMSRDRASGETMNATQASLAAMLGVRRVGVTQAAGALQRRGLIRYSRGRLNVTDRPGLERAACGCYRTDCTNHQRWLGGSDRR